MCGGADITSLRLGWRFIYLAIILDAYTRAVRGWALSHTMDEDLTLAAVEMALHHGSPRVFHSDQGSQYTAWRHTPLLRDLGGQISLSATGQPTQNGVAERFIGILKQEHVDYAEYDDYDDAFRQLKPCLDVEYMTERIHSALDYLTPPECEAAALAQPSPLLSTARKVSRFSTPGQDRAGQPNRLLSHQYGRDFRGPTLS
jgi:transposase InsO family protein